MKRHNITAIAFCVIAIASCKQTDTSSTVSNPALEERSLAVKIISDYHLTTYDRPIDEVSDADFISSDVQNSMRKSRFYSSRMAATKSDVEVPDTLRYSEQIPFCADISESTLIYKNGSSEYSQTTNLDPEINPLLSLHESEIDLTHCVAKVEIRDGKAQTYNNVGELLYEKQVEMPDYSEFLAELERCQTESAVETKSGITRDINWLKKKMEKEYKTKAISDASYNVYEKGEFVVLEQYVNGTKGGSGIVVRTFLSQDISKNYGYEQIENGVIRVRCTNSFSNSRATRSSNIPIDGISEENPSRTVIEELSYMNDGTPMIKVSDKEFNVNKIHYNICK